MIGGVCRFAKYRQAEAAIGVRVSVDAAQHIDKPTEKGAP
jgi:hypothetical protein